MRTEGAAFVASDKVMEQDGHRIAFVISVDRPLGQDNEIDEASLHDVALHDQWARVKVAHKNPGLREKIDHDRARRICVAKRAGRRRRFAADLCGNQHCRLPSMPEI
jgi:hypothetical protein